MRDAGRGREAAQLSSRMLRHESGLWMVHTVVEKRDADLAAFENDADFRAIRPYEIAESFGNLLTSVGVNLMLDLLIGAGGTVFSNANAHLGVGDSTTAATDAQADLQAASNKLRKAMRTGSFPSRGAKQVQFSSDFTSAEANFAWQEWAVFNAAAAGSMLNRKVESLGTKASGTTWTLTSTLSIA
jgi:hypothetical protein